MQEAGHAAASLNASGALTAESPWWRDFLIVSLALFLLYQANLRDNVIGDPIPSTLLPASLLLEGDLDLDEFRTLLRAEALLAQRVRFLGALQQREGHQYSSYPVGNAILATPIYAPFAWSGALEEWSDYALLGKLSASLMVALSGGVMFRLTRRLAGGRAAWVLAFAYGAGTVAWPVASQALWQHGPGMLCLALGLLFAVRLEEGRPPAVTAALLGLALGLAIWCRLLNVVPALVLASFVLVRHRGVVLPFAVAASVLVAWLAWYNLATFGELTGGHSEIRTWLPPGRTKESLLDLFTTPIWIGLPGLLVSPSKGLLLHSSFFVFAFAAVARVWRDTDFPIGRYLCAWVALMLVVLGLNGTWWGGGSFGPRYLCEVLAPLTLLLAYAWPRLAARRLWVAIFGASLAVSVGIQALGAFVHPCGWEPPMVRTHQERLWDWRDSELRRCVELAIEEGSQPTGFGPR